MLDSKLEIERVSRTSADNAEFALSFRLIGSAVLPTRRLALGYPTRSARIARGERREGDQRHGPASAPESSCQGRASALPVRLCRGPRKSGYLSTSLQCSTLGLAVHSLKGDQRLTVTAAQFVCARYASLDAGLVIRCVASQSLPLASEPRTERPPLGCRLEMCCTLDPG